MDFKHLQLNMNNKLHIRGLTVGYLYLENSGQTKLLGGLRELAAFHFQGIAHYSSVSDESVDTNM